MRVEKNIRRKDDRINSLYDFQPKRWYICLYLCTGSVPCGPAMLSHIQRENNQNYLL